jgi:hypothetical protein
MPGAIPPLLQYAFMAGCSVKTKARGQLHLYLTLSIIEFVISNRRGFLFLKFSQQQVEVDFMSSYESSISFSWSKSNNSKHSTLVTPFSARSGASNTLVIINYVYSNGTKFSVACRYPSRRTL